MSKVMVASGMVAVIAYFALGYLLDAWAWAWIVFLVPGIVRVWVPPGRSIDASGSGHPQGTLPPGHEGSETPGLTSPPQRDEGHEHS